MYDLPECSGTTGVCRHIVILCNSRPSIIGYVSKHQVLGLLYLHMCQQVVMTAPSEARACARTHQGGRYHEHCLSPAGGTSLTASVKLSLRLTINIHCITSHVVMHSVQVFDSQNLQSRLPTVTDTAACCTDVKTCCDEMKHQQPLPKKKGASL